MKKRRGLDDIIYRFFDEAKLKRYRDVCVRETEKASFNLISTIDESEN